MNIPGALLDGTLQTLAWALWLLVILRCLWRAPWRHLSKSAHLNLFLGMLVALSVFWRFEVGVQPGLHLHLLGAALVTLAFGPQLAFIALNIVVGVVMLSGGGDPGGFAINSLVMAGTAVGLTHLAWRLLDQYLPKNLFIYLFGLGFFAAGVSVACVGLLAALLLNISGTYTWPYLVEHYLPYCVLLAFAEGWLTGIITTVFVVYCPGWMITFDDEEYLRRRSS